MGALLSENLRLVRKGENKCQCVAFRFFKAKTSNNAKSKQLPYKKSHAKCVAIASIYDWREREKTSATAVTATPIGVAQAEAQFFLLVEMAGLEPTTSRSRTVRTTNCATSRKDKFISLCINNYTMIFAIFSKL